MRLVLGRLKLVTSPYSRCYPASPAFSPNRSITTEYGACCNKTRQSEHDVTKSPKPQPQQWLRYFIFESFCSLHTVRNSLSPLACQNSFLSMQSFYILFYCC